MSKRHRFGIRLLRVALDYGAGQVISLRAATAVDGAPHVRAPAKSQHDNENHEERSDTFFHGDSFGK
jgi:hypothetical protein